MIADVPYGYFFIMSKDKRFVLCESEDGESLKLCKDGAEKGYSILKRREKKRLARYKDRIPNSEIFDYKMNPSPLSDSKYGTTGKCVSVWMPESIDKAVSKIAEERKINRSNAVLDILSEYFEDEKNGIEPFLATKIKRIEQEPTQDEETAKIALKLRKIEQLEELWGVSFEKMYDCIDWERVANEKV